VTEEKERSRSPVYRSEQKTYRELGNAQEKGENQLCVRREKKESLERVGKLTYLRKMEETLKCIENLTTTYFHKGSVCGLGISSALEGTRGEDPS